MVNKDKFQEKIGSRGQIIDLLEREEEIILLLELQNSQEISQLEKELSFLTSKKITLHTTTKQFSGKKILTGVKKILLIASGKGGVGKSTVTSLIALSLARKGFKVGLCDLDLHGPSIPKIFGLSGSLEISNDLFLPQIAAKIKIISMGLLIKNETALVWRGPMLAKSLHQFLLKSDWGDLDYLLLDSPPGTGDLHLSLAEKYHLEGAILVSTPQEVALLASHRSCDFLRKMSVKIFGLVGNQVFFEEGGQKHYLFGQGTLSNYATRESLPLLAEIPILPGLSQACDEGSLASWLDKNPSLIEIMDNLIKKL